MPTFASLKLKKNNEYNVVNFQETQIHVLKYLPIEDKIDLIDMALSNAKQINGLYNDLKLEQFFNLYIIYYYTNLTFTQKQKEDESKLYDLMQANGLIDDIIAGMEENQYIELKDQLNEVRYARQKYFCSAAALMQSMIQDLPRNAAAAAQIVDNFDKTKYQNVIDFARSANGGRPI